MNAAELRRAPRDALLVGIAAMYGGLLIFAPSAALVAIGFWWMSNTVAHNFIHRPFFRGRRTNRLFSAYLSVVLGVPQTLWRDRHLAHHAGRDWRLRWSTQLVVEAALIVALWVCLASFNPRAFVGTWIAGWLAGLTLCAIHGHYEHAGGTVSHYGALYNLAFFNDGYHVEHHARPAEHWSRLPALAQPGAASSRWPAVLRWLGLFQLDTLERLVLRSRGLQQFVIGRHTRAFQPLLALLPPVRRVTIVGGGLFPRTALVLRRLLPAAEITIVDRSADNLRRARRFLDAEVRVVEASYAPDICDGADLVVVPLAFAGDRRSFYLAPPAPAVAVHEWIWRARGEAGFVVSFLLLKRLNLATQRRSSCRTPGPKGPGLREHR